MQTSHRLSAKLVQTVYKADDRRTTKSADFIAGFYRSIFSAKLEPSCTAKFIANNIAR